MPKMTYEEEFEYMSNNKAINDKYLAEIKDRFSKDLAERKYEDMSFINEYAHKEDFIMSGSMYKLQTVYLICKNEEDIHKKVCFFSKEDNADTAINKLIFLTLMLRRIEMDPEGEFSIPAYSYIKDNDITVEALLTVIRREALEWEVNIIKNIYQHFESEFDIMTKAEWLYMILGSYEDVTMRMKLTELQLQTGQYKDAWESLNKIPSPTAEIVELMESIRGLINE